MGDRLPFVPGNEHADRLVMVGQNESAAITLQGEGTVVVLTRFDLKLVSEVSELPLALPGVREDDADGVRDDRPFGDVAASPNL